jgi:hypothetical protein
LSDRRAEIVVVAESDEHALLHLRRDDITPLRRKIVAYGDEGQRTRRGRPRNEPLVAPLEGFRPASLSDLSDGLLTEANVEHGVTYWVELWMRGGNLEEDVVHDRVLGAVQWLTERTGLAPESVRRFRATERDIFLIRLPGELLHALPAILPEVYRVVPASPGLRDLVVGELEGEWVQLEVEPPPADAGVVVLIDTGVAPQHPLLQPLLTSDGTSVVVGDPSPVDTHGHGTEMAGLAAYADLGDQLVHGGPATPRTYLTNVRLIAENQEDDDDRDFWPERTKQAVSAGEAEGGIRPVFNLSVGAANPDPGQRTSWSVGLDLITQNQGAGRLFCVAAGNVDVSPQRDDYPTLNLVSFIDDPAQALNVITVGAVTERVAIPVDPVHGNLTALAGTAELSPYSRAGVANAPIKPDLLFEGGNCAPDGALPGIGIGSLSLLTTDRRHAEGSLTTFSWATSAACASVSGLAAEIWRVTAVERPETVRALLIHSARWTESLRAQFPDRRDLIRVAGYGVPSQDLASYSFRTRPTLIIEDALRPAVRREDNTVEREIHFVNLPLPTESLLALGEHEVELSITLSFFAEPNEANRRHYAGAMLRWDVQRPFESEADFRSGSTSWTETQALSLRLRPTDGRSAQTHGAEARSSPIGAVYRPRGSRVTAGSRSSQFSGGGMAESSGLMQRFRTALSSRSMLKMPTSIFTLKSRLQSRYLSMSSKWIRPRAGAAFARSIRPLLAFRAAVDDALSGQTGAADRAESRMPGGRRRGMPGGTRVVVGVARGRGR